MTDLLDAPFQLPPEGMISERADFPALHLSLGLMHLDGAGLRVVSWNGEGITHMSPAKARRMAKELRETRTAFELLPAIRGLEALANRADELLSGLASAPAEGNA